MKKRIAFFDFDGTITTKDTLLEFIRFSKGKFRFYLGFLLNSPWLVAFKLKIISNQYAKERILTHFFGGMPMSAFADQCEHFALQRIPGLLRTKAIHEIEQLKGAGAEVVIVSASPENWISNWAKGLELNLIATRLVIKKDKLTGRIEGSNCHGLEKVRRIESVYQLADFDEIYGYGDSSGDKPMLAMGKIRFFRPFR